MFKSIFITSFVINILFMYFNLLTLHSLFRWLVLSSVVFTIIQSYYCYKKHKPYTQLNDRFRLISVTILHIQMTLGLWLYFISPFVEQFMKNPNGGIHIREVRFFAMEHSLMMLIAVIIATIGSIKTKKTNDHNTKHKTLYKWLLIALIIILLNIPWGFSPLVHRPSLRWF